MSDFRLRTLIREVMDEPNTPADPDKLVKIVMQRIDPNLYREALEQALPAIVGQVVSVSRQRGPLVEAMAAQQPRRGHTPSSKVAAIAEAWKRHLRDNIFTSEGWKFLQDCSAEDFIFAASKRRDEAAALVTNAQEFEKYAAVMDEYKVTRFADLPESVQRDLLDSDQ